MQKPTMGARATDSARVMKFTKALSGTTVILGILQSGFYFWFINCFIPLLVHCFTKGLDLIKCGNLDAEGLNEISLRSDGCVFRHVYLSSLLFVWEFCCADCIWIFTLMVFWSFIFLFCLYMKGAFCELYISSKNSFCRKVAWVSLEWNTTLHASNCLEASLGKLNALIVGNSLC